MLLVLNLIITGIPSIQKYGFHHSDYELGFKPYYNWNTFNTKASSIFIKKFLSFKPYYNWNTFNTALGSDGEYTKAVVLNLIITGIPSIQKG